MEQVHKKKAEAVAEAKSASALSNTLKRERNQLKQQDYKENYLSELDLKNYRNERVMQKHDSIRKSCAELMERRESSIREANERDRSMQMYLKD